MGSFGHPARFRTDADHYRRRAAITNDATLRDVYEELGDAYEAIAQWCDIATAAHRIADALEHESAPQPAASDELAK